MVSIGIRSDHLKQSTQRLMRSGMLPHISDNHNPAAVGEAYQKPIQAVSAYPIRKCRLHQPRIPSCPDQISRQMIQLERQLDHAGRHSNHVGQKTYPDLFNC